MERYFLLLATLISGLGMTCSVQASDVPKSQTFDSNNVKISYYIQGTGQPVVLIHGWLSSASVNWIIPGTFQQLAKKYQVIALDVRGHGHSDKLFELDSYGPELVDDVSRLLDHLKIQQAHIVGYSMGGIITANFLARHPDRVLSGTLGGSGWLREDSVEQRVFAAGGRDGRPTGLCFQSLAKLALAEKDFLGIKAPVTVIMGETDRLNSVYVLPLQKARPEWPVIKIKNAQHINCITKPEFRDEIEKWLQKNSKP